MYLFTHRIVFVDSNNRIRSFLKKYFIFTLLTFSIIFLNACGGGGGTGTGGGNTPPDTSAVLKGVAQKGLFTQLTVKAFPLQNSNGEMGEEVTTSSTSSNYEITVPDSGFYQLEASGTYINEVSGVEETLDEPLLSVIEVDEASENSNINLLTHLAATQVLSNVAQGETVAQAIAAAEVFVEQTLGLVASTDLTQLDMTAISAEATIDDANLQLLLFSAAVLQNADNNDLPVLGDVITGFGAYTSPTEAAAGLSVLSGYGAAALFELVQPNLPQLPATLAVLTTTQPVLLCELGTSCSWQVFNSRTVSLLGDTILESDGEIKLTLQLSSTSDQDIQVQLSSTGTSASAGIDFRPENKIITIAAGQTQASTIAKLILDEADESAEAIQFNLTAIGSDYGIAAGSKLITITDGFGPVLNGASTQVEISSLCLSGLGDGLTIEGQGCADGSISAIPDRDTAALATDLSLQLNCKPDVDPACVADQKDWLVKLSLQSFDKNLDVLVVEQDLGHYWFPANQLHQSEEAAKVETIFAHITPSFLQLLDDAKQKNHTVRLAASLVETGQPVVVSTLQQPVLLPDTIIAGDNTLGYQLQGISQNAECSGDHYLLDAEFTLDGVHDQRAELCVQVSTSNNQIVGHLQDGEKLNLADSRISLPPFHSSHILYGDNLNNRLQTLGADYLVIPSPTDNGASATQRLCEDIDCFQGQGLANETPIEDLSVYLHAEGLPFAFRIGAGYLDNTGIYLGYNARKYLHSGEFDFNDNRHPDKGEKIFSNDTFFKATVSESGLLQLKADGISKQAIAIAEGTGEYAFPIARLTWQAFDIAIDKGQINSLSTVATGLVLPQTPSCVGCGSAPDKEYGLQGDLSLNGQGIALGKLTVPQAASTPGWGIISGQSAFERPGDLVLNSTALVALPGYLFETTPSNSLYGQLLAHVQLDNSNLNRHDLFSDVARLGNEWPVGITLGPQIYSDASGVPAVGTGRFIVDSNLIIDNGVDSPFDKAINIGAKYVIRNSGITGVFNLATGEGAGNMIMHGYDMRFSRFAFRLTDNSLDDYSWIDGLVHLPGNGNFDTQFTSLSLGCDAKFGGGNVSYCDNPGCQQDLDAWHADTDILEMKFTSAQACVAEPQKLSLNQTVAMLALNDDKSKLKPVGIINAIWTKEGKIESSELAPLQNMILDEKITKPGFGIAPREGGLVLLNDPVNYGVIELKSTLMSASRFWDGIQTDIRLANGSDGLEASQSVVVAAGELNNIHNQRPGEDNDTLAASLITKNDYKSFSPDARYDWSSSFGFSLPVYYTSGENTEQASFYGRYQKTDLLIMQAGAGIDYIHPNATKLSFGASANIPEASSLALRLDLTDHVNLGNVTALLDGLGIVLNLEQLFRFDLPLQPLLRGILDLGSSGILYAIEDTLDELLSLSIEGVNENMWEEVAEPIAALQSIPLQLDVVLEAEITEQFETNIFQKSVSLRASFEDLQNMLTVNGALEINDDAVSSPMLLVIDDIRRILREMKQANDRTASTFETTFERALALVDTNSGQMSRQIARLEYAINSISGTGGGILQQAFAIDTDVCRSGSLDIGNAGYLKPAIQQIGDVEKAIGLLKDINNVALVVGVLFVGQSELHQQFQQTVSTINNKAQRLQRDFIEGKDSVYAAVCDTGNVNGNGNGQYQQYLEHALAHFNELQGEITGLITLLEQLELFLRATLSDNGVGQFFRFTTLAIENIDNTLNHVQQQLNNPGLAGQNFTFSELSDQILTAVAGTFPASSPNIKVDVLFAAEGSGQVDLHTGVILPLKLSLEGSLGSIRERVTQLSFSGAYFSADEYKDMIIGIIMNSDGIANIRTSINRYLQTYIDEIMSAQLQLSDQINLGIKAQLAQIPSPLNVLLDQAKAELPVLPVKAATIDGHAIIEGGSLSRIHIGAEFSTPGQAKDVEGNNFTGAFTAFRQTADENSANCATPSVETFTAEITASGPMDIGDSRADASVGLKFIFDLEDSGISAYIPVGLNGGLTLDGDMKKDPFVIHSMGFGMGIGSDEVYLSAGGQGSFDSVGLGLYAFIGRTCDSAVITNIDDDATTYISLPSPFTGIYARGQATIPLVDYKCALNASASANIGSWITIEPAPELGGIIGGALMGELACIGSIRGQVDTSASINTRGDLFFAGSAFAAAGVGPDCDAGTWTSKSRSRKDDWCGTADISIGVKYEDEEWETSPDSPSAIH